MTRTRKTRLLLAAVLAVGILIGVTALYGRGDERRQSAARALVKSISDRDLAGIKAALRDGADPNAGAWFTGMYVEPEPPVRKWLQRLWSRVRGGRATPDASSVWPLLLVALEQENSPEAIKCLLDHGADARATTPDGTSALVWPVLTGDVEMAKLLIKYGADVNAKTNGGKLLKWASQGSYSQDVVRVLKEAGATE
jgi:hypothetical protein